MKLNMKPQEFLLADLDFLGIAFLYMEYTPSWSFYPSEKMKPLLIFYLLQFHPFFLKDISDITFRRKSTGAMTR